ncbi:anti-sigma factor family protein [Gymnodinialimonas ulvae]|uniref:anti-sigma factor family protein n=1 Tax=Gymnodinialimonas ulvae TaxID=3126504 RepID=UPI00309FBB5E
MTQDRDADLVALLDGVLPDAEADALRAEMAADPALQARLAVLDVDLSGLRGSADALLASAPPVPADIAAPRGSVATLAMAASVALALVLGGVLVGTRLGGAEDWRDYAAAYHLLYQPETLAAPVQGDGGVAYVSEALGHDLSALTEIEGLDFRRAQVLGWEGETLVQFAYLDASGRPVAVCVMATNDGAQAVLTQERHGLSTTTIPSGALQVLVIGPDAETDTEALGARVAAQL